LKDDGTYQDIHDDDPGSLICNFGDFIASLTDGKVRSPWHKVVLPGKGENRHSLVHFYYPSSTYPAVRKVIYQQNRPLGLFVDQSKTDGELWNVDESISNMG
jgi:isopenicillin N synthase-like dioxygenase